MALELSVPPSCSGDKPKSSNVCSYVVPELARHSSSGDTKRSKLQTQRQTRHAFDFRAAPGSICCVAVCKHPVFTLQYTSGHTGPCLWKATVSMQGTVRKLLCCRCLLPRLCRDLRGIAVRPRGPAYLPSPDPITMDKDLQRQLRQLIFQCTSKLLT